MLSILDLAMPIFQRGCCLLNDQLCIYPLAIKSSIMSSSNVNPNGHHYTLLSLGVSPVPSSSNNPFPFHRNNGFDAQRDFFHPVDRGFPISSLDGQFMYSCIFRTRDVLVMYCPKTLCFMLDFINYTVDN